MTEIDPHKIDIPTTLRSYVDPACARLAYLYPTVKLKAGGDYLEAYIPPELDADRICQEIHYALYREKIFDDTKELRAELFKLVSS